MSIHIRKRILKTLERLKFKSLNPNSHIYGYFPAVRSYKNNEYITYEIDNLKIVVYSNGNINFYYSHVLQAVVKSFFRITLISTPKSINNILNEIDILTNNNTK